MRIRDLFLTSRPRFWGYLMGPWLIGWAIANGDFLSLTFWVGLLYYSLPANLLLYGINDIFDRETDAHNTKKTTYETQLKAKHIKNLWLAIIASNIAFFPFYYIYASNWIYILWVLFSVFYSAPPIRAKSKPFLDGAFNVLYILPAVLGYTISGGENINFLYIVAGILWAMSMHAYSAIPDTEPDKNAGINTTAVFLGKDYTFVYCGVLWVMSAILLSFWNVYLGILGGAIYLFLLIWSYKTSVERVYPWFPWANNLLGFILFWAIIIHNQQIT